MILQSEKQLECINKIYPKNRILHVDATGGLVKITKNMRDYPQLLNYVLLMKVKNSDLDIDGKKINCIV